MAVNVKSVETKNIQKSTGTTTSAQAKKAENFFNGVKAEFGKITWTSKDELSVYTKIVVGATFVCGLGVYLVDLSIRGGLAALEAFARMIFG